MKTEKTLADILCGSTLFSSLWSVKASASLCRELQRQPPDVEIALCHGYLNICSSEDDGLEKTLGILRIACYGGFLGFYDISDPQHFHIISDVYITSTESPKRYKVSCKVLINIDTNIGEMASDIIYPYFLWNGGFALLPPENMKPYYTIALDEEFEVKAEGETEEELTL